MLFSAKKKPYDYIQKHLHRKNLLSECECDPLLVRESEGNFRDYLDRNLPDLALFKLSKTKQLNLTILASGGLLQAASMVCGLVNRGYEVRVTIVDVSYSDYKEFEKTRVYQQFKCLLATITIRAKKGSAQLIGAFSHYDNYLSMVQGKQPFQFGDGDEHELTQAMKDLNVRYQYEHDFYKEAYEVQKLPDMVTIIDDVMELRPVCPVGNVRPTPVEIAQLMYNKTVAINPNAVFVQTERVGRGYDISLHIKGEDIHYVRKCRGEKCDDCHYIHYQTEVSLNDFVIKAFNGASDQDTLFSDLRKGLNKTKARGPK